MTCPTGKQPFTQAQAVTKARRASRHYSQGMQPYRCPECGAWHFGHAHPIPKPLPVIRRDHQIYSGPMRAGSF